MYETVCRNLTKNWISQWSSHSPDIPECFQYFEAPIYLSIYWFLCLPYIIHLIKKRILKRPLLRLTVTKLIFIACLIGLQFLEIILNFTKGNNDPMGFTISNCCFILCLVTTAAIVCLERRCNAINSGFYFNYWFMHFLLCVVRARTAGLRLHVTASYWRETLVFINLAFVTLSLILSCFSEKMTKQEIKSRALRNKSTKVLEVEMETNYKSEQVELKEKMLNDHKDKESEKEQCAESDNKDDLEECPEYYSSYLSRIVFAWFSGMILKGYKRPLKDEDLWRLNEREYCRNIVPKLLRVLRTHLVLDDASKSTKKCPVVSENTTNAKASNQDPEKERLTDVNNKSDHHNKKDAAKEPKFDPCLFYTLVQCHWPELLISGLYKFVHDILSYLGPILLKLLLQFMAKPEGLYWKGYFIAIFMLLSAMIRTFILHQYFHMVFKIGMRVRSSLISAVYRKSLVLDTASRKDSTVGEIVNLMSIDAQKFLELISYIHMLWSGPFQIVVALILLWFELGPSVLAGLAIMLLMIPINAVIGHLTRKIQTLQLKVTDTRIKMMNEILNGIKVLKLYAWEPSFINFVTDIRNQELMYMKRSAYLSASMSFTFHCAPFLVSLSTFGVYVLVSKHNIIDAEKAFVSISLFNILRFPLMMLPTVISNLIQATVSLRRLTTFLKRSEIDSNAVSHDKIPGISALIENGVFSWDSSDVKPTLQNINISFPERELIAIVGPVGAGKTSIISAMLGEIGKLQGRVNLHGSVAYIPQQAWIVNATIRDNIIFGLPYESCKYQKVLKACCLQKDLEIFRDSDFTEIGEKGINLSGGQKQRISLARACYNDCNVFLFDDPLSAVDSHVGQDLIENVFGPSGILTGSTRIIVTHNLTILPKCDRIIVLNNGQITEEGTYSELIKHAGPFANFIATHLSDEIQAENLQNMSPGELISSDKLLQELQRSCSENNEANPALFSSLSKSRDHIHRSMASLTPHDTEEKMEREKKCTEELKRLGVSEKPKEAANKLIEEEISKEGNVKLAVYMAYVRSIGFGLAGIILGLFIATQSFSLAANLWLVRWSAQSKIASNYSQYLKELEQSSNPDPTQVSGIKRFLTNQRDLNLGIYGLFGLGQVIVELFASITFAFAIIKSVARIHKNLLCSVLRSPMTTFESVPIGRIINRFSSDMNVVGTMLPQYIHGFLLMTLGTTVVMIMIILPNPWIIIPLSLTVTFYILIQRFYVATCRQLKRLESVRKSPIYSHFGETLHGVSSIRAYSLCDRFIKSSDDKVDKNMYAYYASVSSNRWLAVILETIGNTIVFLACIFGVIGLHRGLVVNAGLVGLAVSYALNITQTLNWLVRMSSEVESNIVSVERIEEYSHMTPEAPWENPEKKPNDNWPQGSIKFVNYETRYREGLDTVLKNISFTINPREKVGIVGRTGSGKSSLVLALFRILEKSNGEILIDGIPIHELGLHDIRGRLTIIPQDPVLFSGTLRRNLDPFSKHSDEDIWNVLEMSNLKKFVIGYGNDQLDMVISEGGENLSVGQRQLVCLARALLRHTKILILDEATAAVDLDTDALIQDTIRREFKDCTILTIAHRLNTVLDYDRIMVLDRGSIAEMDTPENLLNNPNSQFYSMAKSANLV